MVEIKAAGTAERVSRTCGPLSPCLRGGADLRVAAAQPLSHEPRQGSAAAPARARKHVEAGKPIAPTDRSRKGRAQPTFGRPIVGLRSRGAHLGAHFAACFEQNWPSLIGWTEKSAK
ncbi:hypothetical protein MTO96_020015 [Rhipicephalus appendiculatus]